MDYFDAKKFSDHTKKFLIIFIFVIDNCANKYPINFHLSVWTRRIKQRLFAGSKNYIIWKPFTVSESGRLPNNDLLIFIMTSMFIPFCVVIYLHTHFQKMANSEDCLRYFVSKSPQTDPSIFLWWVGGGDSLPSHHAGILKMRCLIWALIKCDSINTTI